mgnify:CR=1 FL=1
MLRFGTCAAGPAHAESGSAWDRGRLHRHTSPLLCRQVSRNSDTRHLERAVPQSSSSYQAVEAVAVTRSAHVHRTLTRWTKSGAERNRILFRLCCPNKVSNRRPVVRLLPNSDSVRRSVGLPHAATTTAPQGAPDNRRCRRQPNRTPNRIAVGQQPNRRPSVGPVCSGTDAEQNAILFGAAVGLSRGSVTPLPGTGSSNGSLYDG